MNDFPVAGSLPEPLPRQVHLPRRADSPRITYGLLGITLFVYVLQQLSVPIWGYALPGMDWLVFFGARWNAPILQGEFWRFFTPLLLHGSLLHIGFNMYALISFGSFLEVPLGHRRFLLLYLLSGLSGNALSFLLSKGYSIGASTALFGLIAAEGIFFFRNRALLGSYARQAMGNILFILIVNLLLGLSPAIDQWGHLGGLLGGLIFAWFATPRYKVVADAPSDLVLEDQSRPWDEVLGAALTFLFALFLIFMKFL